MRSVRGPGDVATLTPPRCDYDCLVTEFIHHVAASINGEYPLNGCREAPQEWDLCDEVSGESASALAVTTR